MFENAIEALLGFIIGIAIGFIATRIISITGNIQIGEFVTAILVSIYFWIYCRQIGIKLAKPLKFTIAFLIVAVLSINLL